MNLLKQYNEHDNIFEKIYHFMWSKDENYQDTKAIIKINLPHTILFDHGQPLFWYFSDKNLRVRKKRRENILFDEIERLYLKDVQEGEVVAYFIHRDTPCKGKSGKKGPLIEYYLKEDFLNFIRNNIDKFPTGMLQKFVKPLSDKNTLIQVNWSQKLSILTRKKNYKNYSNHKLDPYERCCTFDGPEFFSESVGVKGVIGKELNEICNSIVERRKESSNRNKKFNNTPLGFKKIEIPNNVDNLATINLQRPLKLVRDIVCLNCSKKGSEDQFTEIPYQYVIHGREELSQQEMNENGSKTERNIPIINNHPTSSIKEKPILVSKSSKNIIPSVIETLHPKISAEVYLKIKNDFQFQNRTVFVCYDCFYSIVKAKHTSGGLKVDWYTLMKNHESKYKGLVKSNEMKKIIEEYKRTETSFLRKIVNKNKSREKKQVSELLDGPTQIKKTPLKSAKVKVVLSSSENSFDSENTSKYIAKDKKLTSSASAAELGFRSSRASILRSSNKKFQNLLSSTASRFDSKLETENSDYLFENSKLSKLFVSNHKTIRDLINESDRAVLQSRCFDVSPFKEKSGSKVSRDKSPYENATGRLFMNLKKNINNGKISKEQLSSSKEKGISTQEQTNKTPEKVVKRVLARSVERGNRKISGNSFKKSSVMSKFDFSNVGVSSPYLTFD